MAEPNLIQKEPACTIKPGEKGDDSGVEQITEQLEKKITLKQIDVYFDLETTGLEATAHITQIAAVGPMGEFNEYVMPKKPIHPKAYEVTGIEVKDGQMYFKGEKVNALGITTALNKFFDFLGQEVTLVGHNVHRFDVRVLYNAVVSNKMEEKLSKSAKDVLDTLKMFKELYPKSKSGFESYSQEYLMKKILNKDYEAHNALEDVKALQELVNHVAPSADQREKHTSTVKDLASKW